MWSTPSSEVELESGLTCPPQITKAANQAPGHTLSCPQPDPPLGGLGLQAPAHGSRHHSSCRPQPRAPSSQPPRFTLFSLCATPQVFWKEEERTRHNIGKRKLSDPTPYFLPQLIRGHRWGPFPSALSPQPHPQPRYHLDAPSQSHGSAAAPAGPPPLPRACSSLGLPPPVLPSLSPPPTASLPWPQTLHLQSREKAPPASRPVVRVGEGT